MIKFPSQPPPPRIPDSCSDTDCCQVEPGDMVMDNDTWEENWLFRRQRLVPGGGAGGSIAAIHDPVTMLIPNPEAHVLPTVGNRSVLIAECEWV